MNTIPNPDDWMDVLTIIVVALIVSVPSLLALRTQRTLGEVRQQVKNAHKTNLRDDLDRAIHAVEKLSHDVMGLRRDIADEEERRRVHVNELREDFSRKITELNRRIG